jgi:hypothetical protein
MKIYEPIVLNIYLIVEDAVRCSNDFTYGNGDSIMEDIFD